MEATLQFLGTGGSMGVPVIGCNCSVCTSSVPQDKRMRSSAVLTVGNKRILIDCGPDFRTQALRFKIDTLDGLILTHSHNDHICGVDDLKIYCVRTKKALPCLLSAETECELQRRFYYLFRPSDAYHGMTTSFDLKTFEDSRGTIEFLGLKVHYFSYLQLGMTVNGLRFGKLAYVTDIKDYDESVFAELKGVETLVVSALRFSTSPMHLTLDDAVDFAKKVGAKHTWFIHCAHELEYNKVNAYLPENMRLAYDGLTIHSVVEMSHE